MLILVVILCLIVASWICTVHLGGVRLISPPFTCLLKPLPMGLFTLGGMNSMDFTIELCHLNDEQLELGLELHLSNRGTGL